MVEWPSWVVETPTNPVRFNGADDLDLLEDAVDELGLVAGADEELLDARAEDAALDLE